MNNKKLFKKEEKKKRKKRKEKNEYNEKLKKSVSRSLCRVVLIEPESLSLLFSQGLGFSHKPEVHGTRKYTRSSASER